MSALNALKHGHAAGSKRPETKEYRAWRNMLRRCYETKNASYDYYGGRGITVCDRWRRDFVAFLADVGLSPSPRHMIDREDGAKNYEPGNVRWVLPAVSARNRRANYHTPKREEAIAAWLEAGQKARGLCAGYEP